MENNGPSLTVKTPGKIIEMLREEQGWTQAELAKRLQTTINLINHWEKDHMYPSLASQQKLGSIFGKTSAELELPVPAPIENKMPQNNKDLLFSFPYVASFWVSLPSSAIEAGNW